MFKKLIKKIIELLERRPAFTVVLGPQFELDTAMGPDAKPEIIHQVEAYRTNYGWSHVSVIWDSLKPTTRLDIAFRSIVGVREIAIEHWYEHYLDAMLGACWHQSGGGAGGDLIFDGFTDTALESSRNVLIEMLTSNRKNIPQAAARHLERAVRIVNYLLSDEGKQLRKDNADVRRQYEDRDRQQKVYQKLSIV